MVFGLFGIGDKQRPTRRDEYDGHEYKGGPNSTDGFTIDGKSWDYRDPANFNDGQDRASDKPTYNRDAYSMTNPLYEYSYGQVRDAAKSLGIQNVDEKDEVDQIIGRIQSPPAAELPQKPKKDKPKKDDAKLAAPAEPVKTVLSKEAAEANAFVDAHNSMTLGNVEPLQGMAVSNKAGTSSPEAADFKQNFQLQLGGKGTPLTFTEATTGTKPTSATSLLDRFSSEIKKQLEPK